MFCFDSAIMGLSTYVYLFIQIFMKYIIFKFKRNTFFMSNNNENYNCINFEMVYKITESL